jgi:hypothetical protein
MSQVSFILRPSYMDTHLSMCSALWKGSSELPHII